MYRLYIKLTTFLTGSYSRSKMLNMACCIDLELVTILIDDCISKMSLNLETSDLNLLEMYYTELFEDIREYSKALNIEKYKDI